MVYDLKSTQWFNVTANGDVPVARSQFCSTISPSLDDSSFQMTVYGGLNTRNKRAYETVYVLTIPAFLWIKIIDKDNRESHLPGRNIGRYEHTCDLYGDRQMIVLGGELMFDDVSQNNKTCDTSHPAIRILDTTTFEWQRDFIPEPEPYMVPDEVFNVIGGSQYYTRRGAPIFTPILNFIVIINCLVSALRVTTSIFIAFYALTE
ncbi:MAG: hypothetical protein Q9164_005257 [Protoblastenia rupestris]